MRKLNQMIGKGLRFGRVIELQDGLKMGSSKNFFAAISKYDFNYRQRGENLVFINNDKAVRAM